jgi:hypothetical protein
MLFCNARPTLKFALAACFLACAQSSTFAETGASMIAIDQMKRGSPPAGFTFARTGRGEEGEWDIVEDRTATTGQAIEQR